MDLATIIDGADRFVAYVEELTSVIGHADRALPLRDHCAGLLTDQGRRRTPGRDVADRVAAWRGRAHQVLAFEYCQGYFIPGTGRPKLRQRDLRLGLETDRRGHMRL